MEWIGMNLLTNGIFFGHKEIGEILFVIFNFSLHRTRRIQSDEARPRGGNKFHFSFSVHDLPSKHGFARLFAVVPVLIMELGDGDGAIAERIYLKFY